MLSYIKYPLVLTLLVGLFMLSGCGKSCPKCNAQAFLDAVQQQDFAKAKQLSTEESHKVLDFAETLTDMAGEELRPADELKVASCEVDGDKATCTYCCDEEGEDAVLSMKNVDGVWMADLSTEEFNENLDEEMKKLEELQEYMKEEEVSLDSLMDNLEELEEDIEALSDSLDDNM